MSIKNKILKYQQFSEAYAQNHIFSIRKEQLSSSFFILGFISIFFIPFLYSLYFFSGSFLYKSLIPSIIYGLSSILYGCMGFYTFFKSKPVENYDFLVNDVYCQLKNSILLNEIRDIHNKNISYKPTTNDDIQLQNKCHDLCRNIVTRFTNAPDFDTESKTRWIFTQIHDADEFIKASINLEKSINQNKQLSFFAKEQGFKFQNESRKEELPTIDFEKLM